MMRTIQHVFPVLAASVLFGASLMPLRAQSFAIQTFAGGNVYFAPIPSNGDNGQATAAVLANPSAVAVDSAANVYISDRDHNEVRRVAADTGIITTIAGTGTAGYSGDNGPATRATLRAPRGLTIDSAGNLYIADTGNHAIRRVSASGVITTVAGTGVSGNGADNIAATTARLNSPAAVALQYSTLWIADSGNNVVRFVDLDTGKIWTPQLAHSSSCATSTLCNPQGLVFAGQQIWVADTGHCRIGTLDVYGLTPKYGLTNTPCGPGGGDGTAAMYARIDAPAALFVDGLGNVYIAESGSSSRIRWIPYNDPEIFTIAGTGVAGFNGDAPLATNASLSAPLGITKDANGRILIADTGNNRVRALESCFQISPTSAHVNSYPASGTIQFTGPKGCKWSALPTGLSFLHSIAAGDGNGTGDYSVEENTGPDPRSAKLRFGTRVFTLNQDGYSNPALSKADDGSTNGVLNAGDLSASMISPGARVVLRGHELAPTSLKTTSTPWPFRLGNTDVAVNGVGARILSISPNQMEVEIPWGFQSDLATLSFFANGRTSQYTVPAAATAPSLFSQGRGPNDPGRLGPDGTYQGPLSATNRLSPGDGLVLVATGTGIVDLPPADGDLSKVGTNSYHPISVTIGGVEAPILAATLAFEGGVPNVGATYVITGVPPEVPAGDAVPVVLSTGSALTAPLNIPVSVPAPLQVTLSLDQPGITSAPPATWLPLHVTGLHPNSPAGVRFFSGTQYSRTVMAMEVTENSLVTVVPPYYDSVKAAFGSGTVSIEVVQTINGRLVTSNRVDGFRIEDLPTTDLPPGTLTSAMLRALDQTSIEMEGALSSVDAITLGKIGTAGERGQYEQLRDATRPIRAAVDAVMNGSNPSQPLGKVNGQALALDADVLAATDRMLAAMILANPPLAALSPAMRSSMSASSFFSENSIGGGLVPREVPVVLDCNDPSPPAYKQVVNRLLKRDPYTTYAEDWRSCMARLRKQQLLIDLSNDLSRNMEYQDRKIKQALAYLGIPLGIATLGTPLDERSVLVSRITKAASVPTYINLAGQSFLAYLSYFYWDKNGQKVSDVILHNMRSQLREETRDLMIEKTVTQGFEKTGFEPAETLGKALSTWEIAVAETVKTSAEAGEKGAEPEIVPDGKGGNKEETTEGAAGDPVSITGTVTDPVTGEPLQDSQISVCPALPGQSSQASRTQGATYDDGSYTVIVPVDFTRDDGKVCKLVIHPEKGPDQTGNVDLNNGPKVINFPDDSPAGDVNLRGQDIGTGTYADCGATADVGLFNINMTLQNVSWPSLLTHGGAIAGTASFRLVTASCSNKQITYGSEDVIKPVTGNVDPGGQGRMKIDLDNYDVAFTETGVTGKITAATQAARCFNTIKCSFNLVLERIR